MKDLKHITEHLSGIISQSNIKCELFSISEKEISIRHTSNKIEELDLWQVMIKGYGKGSSSALKKEIFNKKIFMDYYREALKVRKKLKNLGFAVYKQRKSNYGTSINEDYHITTERLCSRLRKEKIDNLLKEVK